MKSYYMQSPDGHIITTDSPHYWSEYKQLTNKEGKAQYVAQQIKQLKKWLKPGSTVHTVLRNVSSSGMSRRISCFVQRRDGPLDITGYAAEILDYRRNDKDGGLVVSGCGMDMGFAVVYALSRRMWPKGFKVPKGGYGRNGDTSGFDRDGGYALKQRWM